MPKRNKTRAATKLPVVKDPQLYWMSWPQEYDGEERDRGEVFRLTNQRNDEKLLRIGYIYPLPPGTETSECGTCGKEFKEMDMRDGHTKKRHGLRTGRHIVSMEELTPRQRANVLNEATEYETEAPGFQSGEDADADKEERFLQEVSPLHLDKTAASRR